MAIEDSEKILADAAALAKAGADIIDAFANGDIDESVNTDSGQLMSLATLQRDYRKSLQKALNSSRMYSSAAAGLANTVDQEYFFVYSVSNAKEIYRVYKNNGGTAVDQNKVFLSGTDLANALAEAKNYADIAEQNSVDIKTINWNGLPSPANSDNELSPNLKLKYPKNTNRISEDVQRIRDSFDVIDTIGGVTGTEVVGFTQKNSTVTRKLKDKLSEYVSVDDFGAVANTSVDSYAAIQAAIDSGAKVIGFPGSGYKSQKQLKFKSNGQVLLGSSVEGTTLLLPTVSDDSILCSGFHGCGVGRIKLVGSGNMAGSIVAVENCSQFMGVQFRVQNGYNGVRFDRINSCKLERFVIADNTGTAGILFKGTSEYKSDVLNLVNGEISHFNNNQINGIHWQSYAHSLTMTNVRVIRGGRGLFAENSSGDQNANSYPSFLQILGSEFDYSGKECIRLDCMRDAWITNLYAHGSINADNVYFGADTSGIRVSIPRSASALKNGIYVAGKMVEIIGGHIYNNSQSGSAQNHGIYVAASANNVQILGVISGNTGTGLTPSQGYGLYIESGASNIKYDGDFSGNVTGSIITFSDKTYEVGGNYRHSFKNGNGIHFEVGSGTANVVNSIRALGNAAGAAPSLIAQGSDATIDFVITPKGSGAVIADGNMITTKNNLPSQDNFSNFGSAIRRWMTGFFTKIFVGAGTVSINSGAGSPEGAVTAPPGSIYLRSDGGSATSLYVKESGTGNTGWIAK